MRLRYLELLRAGWGAVLLVAPGTVLTGLRGVQVDRKAIVVARILGGRQLVQAALSGIRPSPEILAAGVWVDGAHALTALGLALADRRRARIGVADGLVAASWAGLGLHNLRNDATAPADGRRDQLARIVIGRLPGGSRLMAVAARARSDARR
jgi:hypothetical protein